MMNKMKLLPVAAVIAVGVVLGVWIMRGKAPEKSTQVKEAPPKVADQAVAKNTAIAEPAKGPHGGRYFNDGPFGLEVTIYERGVPPRFRIYLYENAKPLDPAAAKVSLTLSRLGANAQLFSFAKEADYLRGDQIVREPHSFDVAIAAERNGKTYRWGYSQVEARVAMTDDALKGAGVEVKTAGPARIKTSLQLPGEIKFNQDRLVHIVPRVAGVVASAPVAIGQNVRRGEVLLVLESQSLAELRSQLMATQKRLALAGTTYDREKKLWEQKISAEQDYLAARAALNEAEIAADTAAQRLRVLGATPGSNTASLARYEIRAPIDGTLVERDAALGEALKEDAHVFTLADLSSVWAEFAVYARDLAAIKIGQPATVNASAFDAQATGKVSYIGSLVGEQTRTATARVVLKNPDMKWRPGMFVTVELIVNEVEVPVAVSVDAIQTLRDWSVVFGRYGKFLEARPLELGRSDGKWVEVIRGLSTGERYAAGNSFVIKAELGKAGATHDH